MEEGACGGLEEDERSEEDNIGFAAVVHRSVLERCNLQRSQNRSLSVNKFEISSKLQLFRSFRSSRRWSIRFGGDRIIFIIPPIISNTSEQTNVLCI